MDEDLPFELRKNHKYDAIWHWKKNGLKEDEETILEIYEGYIRASNCELCGNPFKSSRDRQMDHCHVTGKFRNIVCKNCNNRKSDKKINSNTSERYIYKVKDKRYKQGFFYQIRIYRNGKWILDKSTQTLQEAIEVRDKFLEENSDLFT